MNWNDFYLHLRTRSPFEGGGSHSSVVGNRRSDTSSREELSPFSVDVQRAQMTQVICNTIYIYIYKKVLISLQCLENENFGLVLSSVNFNIW